MNNTITTGAAVAGSGGITLAAQDVFSDLFTWLHLPTPSHPGSWAALAIVAAGLGFHYLKGKADAQVPQAPKP